MEKLFLSSLKNRIAWQSLRNAAFATLALLLFAAYGFSVWVFFGAIILFSVAFFLEKEGRNKAVQPIFFVFSVTAIVSILLLFLKSSFFDYWTMTQWMPFILSFFFYGVIFMAPFMDTENERNRVAFLRTITLLFLAVSVVLFTERSLLLGYLFLFGNVFILFRGAAREELGGYSIRTRSLALLMALISIELLFVLRFLPLLFLVEGGLIAVFLVLLWDVTVAHMNGKLSQKLIMAKALLFSLFLIFAALFTKWSL